MCKLTVMGPSSKLLSGSLRITFVGSLRVARASDRVYQRPKRPASTLRPLVLIYLSGHNCLRPKNSAANPWRLFLAFCMCWRDCSKHCVERVHLGLSRVFRPRPTVVPPLALLRLTDDPEAIPSISVGAVLRSMQASLGASRDSRKRARTSTPPTAAVKPCLIFARICPHCGFITTPPTCACRPRPLRRQSCGQIFESKPVSE